MSIKKCASLGMCALASLFAVSAQSHTVQMRISATILPACRVAAAANTDDRAVTSTTPSIQMRCNTRNTAPPPRQVWEPTPDAAARAAAGELASRESPRAVSSSAGMLTLYY